MRFPNGRESIGVIQDEQAVPLLLAAGHFQTLAEILEADDPVATVEFLIDHTPSARRSSRSARYRSSTRKKSGQPA